MSDQDTQFPVTRLLRGLKRPRHIAPGDLRSPMRRLLEDCQTPSRVEGGLPHIEVNYERQFQTLWKAERLGYVEQAGGGYRLTQAGLAALKALVERGTDSPEHRAAEAAIAKAKAARL